MTPTISPSPESDPHAPFSRRMQWLTVLLGGVGAVVAAFLKSPRFGIGVAVGTLLAWLNFRWLDRGLGVLISAAVAQQGSPKPRVPLGVYVRFAGRYLLIGLAVYVSVVYFGVPLLAVLLGLLALGAAAITEGLYELISGNA